MVSDDGAPATKADLKKLGNEFGIKLNGLENKLDKKIEGVAVELIKTQADVRQIKETMSTKADVDRIMNAIDAFARKAEAYDRKALSHGDQLQGHEAKLQDHEKRLSAVESKP
ncbi:MAG: hypothetical protein ABII00_17665 [Elusimicrobiota bacterium]